VNTFIADHRLHKRVCEDEMDVDTDVLVRDRSVSQMSVPTVDFSETGWPMEYRMGESPLSNNEGVAGPSGLTAEEKEKTLGEMEIEDVAGPSENPAVNAALAVASVKVEEEENVNRVRYEIVEVAPGEPVIEGAPAMTVEGGELVMEPKLEPVELVILPVIVRWTKKNRKKLWITTRKIVDKDMIEILDSEDELLVVEEGSDEELDEEEGKELDAKDGDGKVPDS
jgi:hypothetical protein